MEAGYKGGEGRAESRIRERVEDSGIKAGIGEEMVIGPGEGVTEGTAEIGDRIGMWR